MLQTQSILKFWFPSDTYQSFWFDGSKDAEIILCFKDVFISSISLMSSNPEYFNNMNYDEKLASIIVFDQFSRSIYRDNMSYDFRKETEYAYQLSESLIVYGVDKEYPISHLLFILMPYRHLAVMNNNSNLIDVVLSVLDKYENTNSESSLLNRFRHSTYQNLTVLTDRILLYQYENSFGTIRDYDEVIDPVCNTYGSLPLSLPLELECLPLYQTMKHFFVKSSHIGVSLSGGVDSMVILYLLKVLVNEKHIKSVCALHLSYMSSDLIDNKESEESKNLIGLCCSLWNIPLYVRTIPYCREKTDRFFYEKETKAVRFSSYRYLSNKKNISGWCLGHHHGDVGENVMMNLCNGRSLLDLKVMDKISFLHNVTLYRPLLSHPKKDIYSFAHMFMIPYLKDTTPDWSCRGVLRRKVFPPLIDQYPSILNTLENVSNESYEWKMVIDQFVIEPIKRDIVFDFNRKIVTMTLRGTLPKVIWSSIFLYIFHSMGVHMISHKNMIYFYETYERNLFKKHRFMFSNHCVGIFMENRDSDDKVVNIMRIIRLNEK